MIRNLDDYKQDVTSIISFYWQHYDSLTYEGKRNFLNKWLSLRNYSPEELDFISTLTEMEMTIELSKNLTSNAPLEWNDWPNYEVIDSITMLIEHLSGNKQYPSFIENSDHPCVRLKEKLKKAETWAIDNGFIGRETGKWAMPKGRLAAFLFILEDEKIISGPTKDISRNQIDEYFTDRYCLGERLEDSFKWSGKADRYKDEFTTLKFTLSINRNEN